MSNPTQTKQKEVFPKKNNSRFFPRSIYHFSLASIVVITLPLLLAIAYAVIAVTQYTKLSQHTLINTVRATDGSRVVLERLISMERNIRQFQVLKDPELFKVYQTHHQKFVEVAESFKFEGVKLELQRKMDELIKNEARLYDLIIQNVIDGEAELRKEDLMTYASLTQEAQQIVKKGRKQVGEEAEMLSLASEQVRQSLIYSALFSVPLAFLLGLILVYRLTRPIKHIGQAIRELGKGCFDKEIQIQGPQDLEHLGLHLDWLRRRLNQLENDKQLFIKNISHELKTPLATLKEGSGLLEDEIVGELNSEQKEIVELMRLGCIQLNGQIENLLEYQNAIHTQTRLEFSFFDLAALVKRTIDENQLMIKYKGITIEEQTKSIELYADSNKVRIIIGNLLSNAMKFSISNGKVRLSIKSDDTNVYFLIEDQGKGIAKEERERIFNEFYQNNSSTTWPVRGSGLGLKLVNDYVIAHRGTIELLEPNKTFSGARFLLTLPLNVSMQKETIS